MADQTERLTENHMAYNLAPWCTLPTPEDIDPDADSRYEVGL